MKTRKPKYRVIGYHLTVSQKWNNVKPKNMQLNNVQEGKWKTFVIPFLSYLISGTYKTFSKTYLLPSLNYFWTIVSKKHISVLLSKTTYCI